jgi:hypothetical protein
MVSFKETKENKRFNSAFQSSDCFTGCCYNSTTTDYPTFQCCCYSTHRLLLRICTAFIYINIVVHKLYNKIKRQMQMFLTI